jgi:hypothetical protein
MKTQAKYSYRVPKVWIGVQQPKVSKKPTLCHNTYNDQDNDPCSDPYTKDPPYTDLYNDTPNDPFTDSTDDLYKDSYDTLSNKSYNDLNNKDINPSILALVAAKMDKDIGNFFASFTMSKTPPTCIPNLVKFYEDDNLDYYNPNTTTYHHDPDTADFDNPVAEDYLAYYDKITPDSVKHCCPTDYNTPAEYSDNPVAEEYLLAGLLV